MEGKRERKGVLGVEMKKICPNCKGTNIGEWVFGLPSHEFMEEFQKKENKEKYHLGGCYVSNDDPAFHCNDCEEDF